MVGAVKSVSLVAVALMVASCGTMHIAGASGPLYQAAKRQWLGSGLWAGSAAQNLALPVAVRDLRMAESTDAGEKAQYSAAIAQLETIGRMPDAMATDQESVEARAAQSALDGFFKVPQSAPYTFNCGTVVNKNAASAWGKEPAKANAGPIIASLRQAVADLEPEAGRNPCSAAAIDDLKDLESTTKSEIAQSSRPCDPTVVGFEIAYLDAFFMTAAFVPKGQCRG